MPMNEEALEEVVRSYIEPMTSVRGRRVRRLLMREFASFDHVIPATTDADSPALVALSVDGRFSVCGTNGRGPTAEISACSNLREATVATSYDLTKDSLPVVFWTISHSGFDRLGGTLTISAGDLTNADRNSVVMIFRTST
jgi:hypothetical protein